VAESHSSPTFSSSFGDGSLLLSVMFDAVGYSIVPLLS
jgi:hypothetical protein